MGFSLPMICAVGEQNVGCSSKLTFNNCCIINVQKPIKWLNHNSAVVNVNSAKMLYYGIPNQVWPFCWQIILKLCSVKYVTEIRYLIKPMPNIWLIEMPQLPPLGHGFVVELKQLQNMLILCYFLFPYCPNDFGNPFLWLLLLVSVANWNLH
jgi:hypothetical protein